MKKSWTTLAKEQEYEIALERAIEIFHAESGTPEGDELNILLPLIIAYENIHHPIPAPEKNTL